MDQLLISSKEEVGGSNQQYHDVKVALSASLVLILIVEGVQLESTGSSIGLRPSSVGSSVKEFAEMSELVWLVTGANRCAGGLLVRHSREARLTVYAPWATPVNS